ncbi:amino acid adenylation domain-containing protein, partial [Pseudomonas agarici]
AAIWQAVLKVERVGLNDNFFELGGHSLLATQVISRARKALALDVPLRALFEHSVLSDFVKALGQEAGHVEPPLLPVDREQPLELSFAQERQWFLWRLDPQSSAYHIPSALRLHGQLDLPALVRSVDTLCARHESLRTTFVQEGERVFQRIRPQARITIERHHLEPTADASLRESRILAFVEAQTQRLFDLQQEPLMRVQLLHVTPEEQVLVLTQHHIISDGWSMAILVEELIALYSAYSRGETPKLPALPIQYADYAHWQRQWLAAGARARQLEYWTGQLGGEQPILELPADRPRPAVQSHRGASFDIALPTEVASALKDLALREQASLFMVLLASFQALLHRYSGQADIRVGVPIANRNRIETERVIGFFVNTQVLRARVEGQLSFAGLLCAVREVAIQAQAHQDLPFEQLVEALHPQRSLSHSPLFQVMYNHQNETRQGQDQWALPGLRVEGLVWDNPSSPFDLTLDTFDTAQGLFATLTYATDLFDRGTIERMAGHWLNLLRSVATDATRCIGELDLLTPAQTSRLQGWSADGVSYPFKRCVHQRIQAHAERLPEAVALLFGEQQMTYGELEARANQLAHRLRAEGVGPEVLVAIALERSLEMVVGLLAILKAGAAYVPLDPEYPGERLAYLMQDSGVALLLTDSALAARLPVPAHLRCLLLDQLDLAGLPRSAPPLQPDPRSLAYVIYTSGSTGQPKGVMVAHGPLAMHCLAIGERYAMSERDCELHFMSFAFDGAHERWLTTLIHGGRLLIRDAHLWTPEQTYRALHRHGVTVAAFPPAYLQQLAEHAALDGNPPPVRIYCFGGDAVPQASFELAMQALKPQFIINGYGPTETVVTPLIWKAARGVQCDAAYAPIGNRVGDRSVAVLDAHLQRVPQGHEGELYLGGEGVARGYLKRPGLTAERFVPDPFASGGRLYRSGDVVRQRADGVIDYLGRIDHQVKVRGFRIELGEIEARLQEHPAVREAVVLARQGQSGVQLVGYLVPVDAAAGGDPLLTQERLRDEINQRLRDVLPGYMIPTYLLFLQAMPLTPNGKLDRKALPEVDGSLMQRRFVAPTGELECTLAGIWRSVLKLEQVGRNDNFFELGGHSLLATQATAMAQMQLGSEVPLELIFKAGTLHEYATALAGCLNTHSAQDLSDMHDFLTELETN